MFQEFEAFEQFAKKSEDGELVSRIELVKKYGKSLPDYIKLLKQKVLPREERSQADVFFSTVHRCKGLEYDEVFLANDFIREKDIASSTGQLKTDPVMKDKTAEEINILYVAGTRAKRKLNLPRENKTAAA